MPVHEVGYRRWSGRKTSPLTRFWMITETGFRLAVQSHWVRRMLFFAWLPVLYWGVGFFVIERALDTNPQRFVDKTIDSVAAPDLAKQFTKRAAAPYFANREAIAKALRQQFRMIPRVHDLARGLEQQDSAKTRNIIWNWLLMTFFRYPQLLLILFLVGSITPTLISRDLRSRAFLLYFSRPIGRFDYILGKLLIPIGFIVFVTTLPALALYVFAILVSPTTEVFWSTWDVPLRVLLSTIALVLPTASIAVMLSSLTQESRYASFSWFALWALGHGSWLAVVFATSAQLEKTPFHPDVMQSATVKNWSVLSLYNNLGEVQAWIFGFADSGDIWKGASALLALTLVSLAILYHRVSAPIRA